MFTLRPPRDLHAPEKPPGGTIVITSMHLAVAVGVFAFLALALLPIGCAMERDARQRQLIRHTKEIQALFGDAAAAEYLFRQTSK